MPSGGPWEHGTRKGYAMKCRCDLCRCAESEYQTARRRRIAEAEAKLAEAEAPPTPSAPTLTVVGKRRGRPPKKALTSANADAPPANTPIRYETPPPGDVEAGIMAEIERLGVADVHPGLVGMAVSLAKVLDNPRAISAKPAAAAKLMDIRNELRKMPKAEGKLASVRAMTSAKKAL